VRDLILIYGFHDYHYITCSCYERTPFMGSVYARDVSVEVFDRVRARPMQKQDPNQGGPHFAFAHPAKTTQSAAPTS